MKKEQASEKASQILSYFLFILYVLFIFFGVYPLPKKSHQNIKYVKIPVISFLQNILSFFFHSLT